MVTIKDIAEACGVSVATVSRALNGLANPENRRTRDILRKAREMGYYPNSAARTLKTSRSNNIGVIFEDRMDHEFFSLLLNEVRFAAENQGVCGENRLGNFLEGGVDGHIPPRHLKGDGGASLDVVTGGNVSTAAETAISIEVANNLDSISPTNVVMRFAPYLFILGGAVVLLAVSRRRKAEQE